MQLTDIVCDKEYAAKLKELKVRRPAFFRFNHLGGIELNNEYDNDTYYDCDTYTVAELGAMLPKNIGNRKLNIYELDNMWHCGYKMNARNFDNHSFREKRDSKEANARAKLLIYLIEQSHVKPEDLNNG